MSVVKKLEKISIDDYLNSEELGDVRHEFVDGVIYAMVGASVRHNLITGALFSALRTHLRGSPCYVFQSDMKVRVEHAFYYPDLMVTCSGIDPAARYVSDAVLIIEVLSPATEGKDRLEKLVAYRHLASIKEYVLVSQDKMQLEIFRREEDGWQVETCGHGDNVNLKSVNLTLPITVIYEDVMGISD